MSVLDVIGSIGVAVLLGAFFANLFGWIETNSRIYSATNLVGATLAAVASWGIGFMPFVVLEGTWASVALVSLLRSSGSGQNPDRLTG